MALMMRLLSWPEAEWHGMQAVQTLMARLELHATASAWPVGLASGNHYAGAKSFGPLQIECSVSFSYSPNA